MMTRVAEHYPVGPGDPMQPRHILPLIRPSGTFSPVGRRGRSKPVLRAQAGAAARARRPRPNGGEGRGEGGDAIMIAEDSPSDAR
jgi:hypothetical protein